MAETGIVPVASLIDNTSMDERLQAKRRRKEARLQAHADKAAAAKLQMTLYDVAYALRKHRGIVLHAAQEFGITRAVLWRRIEMAPSLMKLYYDLREEWKDTAEAKLLDQVEEGSFAAVSLLLKTQAKDRGYTEKATVEHEVGKETMRTAASLIEAMRRGADTVRELEKEEALEVTWVEAPVEKSDQTS